MENDRKLLLSATMLATDIKKSGNRYTLYILLILTETQIDV